MERILPNIKKYIVDNEGKGGLLNVLNLTGGEGSK
jgi:hypothetical protein